MRRLRDARPAAVIDSIRPAGGGAWPPCSYPPWPAPRRARGSPSRPRTRPSAGRSSPPPGAALSTASAPRPRGRFICTGACLSTWHPLVVPAGAKPKGPVKLGTIERPEGKTQVTFKGRPLYSFAGDTKAGRRQRRGDQGRRHLACGGHREEQLLSQNRSLSRSRKRRTRIRQSPRRFERRAHPVQRQQPEQPRRQAGGRARTQGAEQGAALGDPAEPLLEHGDGEIAADQVTDDEGQQGPVGAEVGTQQDAGGLRRQAAPPGAAAAAPAAREGPRERRGRR